MLSCPYTARAADLEWLAVDQGFTPLTPLITSAGFRQQGGPLPFSHSLGHLQGFPVAVLVARHLTHIMLQSAISWSTGTQLARCIVYQPAFPCRLYLTPNTHVARPLTARRPLKVPRQPVNRRQPASCSAVVDRPQESDLNSAGLGWPKGFHTRYALREQLGKGSFGTVYLATDIVTGQEVAAKIIPKERKGTTTEHILEKIQQEVIHAACFSNIAGQKFFRW